MNLPKLKPEKVTIMLGFIGDISSREVDGFVFDFEGHELAITPKIDSLNRQDKREYVVTHPATGLAFPKVGGSTKESCLASFYNLVPKMNAAFAKEGKYKTLSDKLTCLRSEEGVRKEKWRAQEAHRFEYESLNEYVGEKNENL